MFTITYFGHSCFKFDNGVSSVVFDPYKDGSVPGLQLPLGIQANEVLCSHNHGDHNASELIEVIEGPKMKVTEIPTFHDDCQGKLRGNSIIHLVSSDGLKIAHFGDIGCALTDEQIRVLKGLDIAFVPVGGHYTIDAKTCKKMVEEIEPKCTILMHYREGEIGYDVLSSIDDVLRVFPETKRLDSSIISFSKDDIPEGTFTFVPQQ